MAVACVQIVTPLDVYLNGSLGAGHHGHPQKPAQGVSFGERQMAHAGNSLGHGDVSF